MKIYRTNHENFSFIQESMSNAAALNRGGIAGHYGSRDFATASRQLLTCRLCKQLTKALEMIHSSTPSPFDVAVTLLAIESTNAAMSLHQFKIFHIGAEWQTNAVCIG